MQARLDKFGRIVIPQKIRHDIGIEPGSVLELQEENHRIVLIPIQDQPALMIREGVTVYGGSGDPEEIEKALATDREKRMDTLSL